MTNFATADAFGRQDHVAAWRGFESDASRSFATLTRQQAAVMDRLACGMSNKEIAGSLNLSRSTVKTHIWAIYQKTKIANRVHLSLNWLKYRGVIQEAGTTA
jgi:DNA-binding NarL/FixJ family response regulator